MRLVRPHSTAVLVLGQRSRWGTEGGGHGVTTSAASHIGLGKGVDGRGGLELCNAVDLLH